MVRDAAYNFLLRLRYFHFVKGSKLNFIVVLYFLSLAGKPQPSLYACFCHGLRKFGVMLGTYCLLWLFLIVTFVLVFGLGTALVQANLYGLVVILGIIYFGICFTVWMTSLILVPILLVEKDPDYPHTGIYPVAAIRRALILSRGLRCYFFGAAVCVWMAHAAVLGLLQGVAAQTSLVVGVVLATLASLISMPLTCM